MRSLPKISSDTFDYARTREPSERIGRLTVREFTALAAFCMLVNGGDGFAQ